MRTLAVQGLEVGLSCPQMLHRYERERFTAQCAAHMRCKIILRRLKGALRVDLAPRGTGELAADAHDILNVFSHPILLHHDAW